MKKFCLTFPGALLSGRYDFNVHRRVAEYFNATLVKKESDDIVRKGNSVVEYESSRMGRFLMIEEVGENGTYFDRIRRSRHGIQQISTVWCLFQVSGLFLGDFFGT